ncbi:MAG: hypothetical protein CM15mP74_20550 [Halieaceae bacterium]|nr:MAG: hypothetical protein CM15mP74_20550 [Halieaceae bacterium]
MWGWARRHSRFHCSRIQPGVCGHAVCVIYRLCRTPRSIANASTGFIVEDIGWVQFFLLCMVLAIPGMVALVWVAPWRATESCPESRLSVKCG